MQELSDDQKVVNADGSDQSISKSDIVVIGSRIRSANAVSDSPMTTITNAEIFDSGRISVGDVLNDLPQLRTTLGSQNLLTGSLGLR